jgi:hypothetical protein
MAALTVTSCFSVQTRRRPVVAGAGESLEAGTGGIELRVFADDTTRRHGQPGPRGLFVELERKAGAKYEPVFRSLEPAWGVLGLPPGEYRLRFPSRLDEAGEEVAMNERPRRVRVRAGEVTEVDAVLEHVDKGLVVAGVVAAVVVAVLLEDWLDDHDLPLPPLPPPPHVLDAIFWISLDLAHAETHERDPWSHSGPSRPPVVTSHFPADGATVGARRVRITFSLSEPVDRDRVAEDCIEVVGERSGRLDGFTEYDERRWWFTWEADAVLPRGDELRVTLFADCVADLRGTPLAADQSFSFRTAE